MGGLSLAQAFRQIGTSDRTSASGASAEGRWLNVAQCHLAEGAVKLLRLSRKTCEVFGRPYFFFFLGGGSLQQRTDPKRAARVQVGPFEGWVPVVETRFRSH